MEYAKITIKQTSSFLSLLQSDTIFGNFAWGMRFVYGEKRLMNLLEDFKANPFIIFSDGFNKGYLPKPLLMPYLPEDNEIKLAKKIKKSSFLKKEILFENVDNLSDEKIFNILKSEIKNSLKKVDSIQITQKNSVNRLTNSVKEGLYSIKEDFSLKEIEIYFAYQNISKDEIVEVFNYISKKGFGKDKSTGKGKFTFKIDWEFKEKKYFTQKRGKFLSLSHTFYNPKNMLLYYGKTITKFPKAGGIYAFSRPYKNPCIMYIPGSTFIAENYIIGDAEDRVYNLSNHYQNGFGIGIFFDGE